jgi:glutathione peroxidase-family protein
LGDWTKFLIDRKGKIIDSFESNALPNDYVISALLKEETKEKTEEEKHDFPLDKDGYTEGY